jgi:hypothetical protein
MLEDAPRESLVILETRVAAAALVQLRAVATVTQRLAPRLALIRTDAQVEERARRIAGVLGVYTATPGTLPPDLTPAEGTFIAAWEARQQPKSRPGDGQSWDSPGLSPPDARTDRAQEPWPPGKDPQGRKFGEQGG